MAASWALPRHPPGLGRPPPALAWGWRAEPRSPPCVPVSWGDRPAPAQLGRTRAGAGPDRRGLLFPACEPVRSCGPAGQSGPEGHPLPGVGLPKDTRLSLKICLLNGVPCAGIKTTWRFPTSGQTQISTYKLPRERFCETKGHGSLFICTVPRTVESWC